MIFIFIESSSGVTIKEFTSKVFIVREEHIFSKKHLEEDIMNLGKDRTEILNKLVDIVLEY